VIVVLWQSVSLPSQEMKPNPYADDKEASTLLDNEIELANK